MRKILFAIAAWLLGVYGISAQAQPRVQISVSVLPPYSADFFEQVQRPGGVFIQLNFPGQDPTAKLSTKLLFTLSGDNGAEINLQPSYTPPAPLVLSANQPLQLQGLQLSEYFREENFVTNIGDPRELRVRGGLPEGIYRLCVQAVDYQRPEVAYSNVSCSNAFVIRYSDPPALIRPMNKQLLTELQSRNLVFSWQPPVGLQPGIQYRLKIVEMIPADREPGDAMASATTPPFFEKTMSAPVLLYTPDLPVLVKGRSYAWQVTAEGIKGQKLGIRNEGTSEVYMFTVTADSTGTDSTTNDSTSTPCYCAVTNVAITQTAQSPNFFSYQGTVEGSCTGDYYCEGVSGVEYLWKVVSGSANIEGADNGSTVDIATAGPGKFSIELTGTVICTDGTRCSSSTTIVDSFQYEPKNCDCSVDVDCKKVQTAGNIRTFEGVLNGGCNGEFGVTPPYEACAIENITWFWQVIEGGDVAEIDGANNQQTVNVKIKGVGPYKLRVQADVECNDGTKNCGEFNFDYCLDTVKVEKKCSFQYKESNSPAMAGGLADQTPRDIKIPRDEYLPLIASGRDFDKVTIECTPSYDCDNGQKKSTKDVLLAGKVRFEWEIQSGEGNFVKMGNLPQGVTSDVGNRVLFQPPYVALSETEPVNRKTTVIFLRVVDETGTGPLLDEHVYDRVTIITSRTRFNPDHYEIVVQNIRWQSPRIELQEDNNGVCKAEFAWDKPNDLVTPVIKLPAVPDNGKMVLGQRMILEAENQNETDELKMLCNANDCEDEGGKKEYYDDIEWRWNIDADDGTKGKLIGGKEGRYVIYEAPDRMPSTTTNELTVSITVSVLNTGFQKNDVTFTSRPINIKIFRPGVQIEYPPLAWIPEEGISVNLKSYLLYFEGGQWKSALEHMARIHFFELLDVSREKGLNMNEPVPRRARECRDLLLKKEAHTEVFDRRTPTALNCFRPGYYMHSRTQKPLKDATIRVHSEDFGSYGFIRSFANINQGGRDSIRGERPVYEPIPIPAGQVAHPQGRAKKTIYSDNRVTVPRDVDENKIADDGWQTVGNVKVNDPASARADNDGQIPGDGFPGDGLSNYEEYRGFYVSGSPLRTNINNKDLFMHNPDGLNLATLRAALTAGGGAVQVHEIYEEEYISNAKREINFNFNPQLRIIPLSFVDIPRVQKGLLIAVRPPINAGTNGRQVSLVGRPAPPNWTLRLDIFQDNILNFSINRGINFANKLAQVSAHETSHGMNVWHHGSGQNQNLMNGVRSGDMTCFMRYDNRLPRVPGYIPEDIGVALCNNAAGTGYNASVPCAVPTCFGNAANLRGNCIAQVRISCRTIFFPKR